MTPLSTEEIKHLAMWQTTVNARSKGLQTIVKQLVTNIQPALNLSNQVNKKKKIIIVTHHNLAKSIYTIVHPYVCLYNMLEQNFVLEAMNMQ